MFLMYQPQNLIVVAMSANLPMNIHYCCAEEPQGIFGEWDVMFLLSVFIFFKPLSEEAKSNNSCYHF